MKTLIIFLSFLLLSGSETLTGKVVKVADGDTITILTKKMSGSGFGFLVLIVRRKARHLAKRERSLRKLAWPGTIRNMNQKNLQIPEVKHEGKK